MKDTALKLQDKTILLAGPFNGITQAILRSMTEFGADIAYVHDQAAHAGRFVEGINEAREVQPQYGRAAIFNLPMGNTDQIKEALGKVAESFGRMDVLIDASPLAWNSEETEKGLSLCGLLSEAVLPFLKAKQRGRIVYVFEDECLEIIATAKNLTAQDRSQLNSFVSNLAAKVKSDNVTVNALTVGVSEDFLLKNFPNSASIRKSLNDLQEQYPHAKLVENHEVAMSAAYLASVLSACLTGQTLRLTSGLHLV